mmetsp:Transcript_36355/g.47961  ORF Transcript_36355/g.47961 Transcript_36355/m.47961 type:complete len:476 (+) Transcript_36355:61-1488(+)
MGCGISVGRSIAWKDEELYAALSNQLPEISCMDVPPPPNTFRDVGNYSARTQNAMRWFQLHGDIRYHFGDIKRYYLIGDIIGRGKHACVKQCTQMMTENQYAVKCINLGLLNKEQQAELQTEAKILASLQHKSIVKLFEVFQFSNVVYMVQEHLQGGELFDQLVRKTRFSEDKAKPIIRNIASALAYCHRSGIVHRDVKPENVLFISNEEESSVKLVDFGFSTYLPCSEEKLTLFCGTPMYVAPEVIQGEGYMEEVDNWSLGVMMYIMLAGFPPFIEEEGEDGKEKLFQQVKEKPITFPSPFFDDISKEALNLISHLLKRDPSKRLTAEEVINHRWMNRCTERSPFDPKRSWKRAIRLVIISNRFKMPKIRRMSNFTEHIDKSSVYSRGRNSTPVVTFREPVGCKSSADYKIKLDAIPSTGSSERKPGPMLPYLTNIPLVGPDGEKTSEKDTMLTECQDLQTSSQIGDLDDAVAY